MPALRIYCCNWKHGEGEKTGPKLAWWLADYDLRGISKYSLVLRCLQLLVILPTFIDLIRTHINVVTIKSKSSSSSPCTVQKLSTLVWFFWFSSLVTVVFSIVLDVLIFRVSSRGSPTQVDERRSLSWLCSLKLVPFSVLRLMTVILAMSTLTALKRLCDQSKPCLIQNGTDPDVDEYTNADNVPYVCQKSTKVMIGLLAYTHIFELSVVAFITLWVVYGKVRKQQRKIHQWWTNTSTIQSFWSTICPGRSRNRRPEYHRSDGATSDITTLSSASLSSWWHGLCCCCCVFTSFCTCCLFGGVEVFRSSTSNDSSLSDISIILADFFNSGSNLDITPSDVVVGISALSMEQRQQKGERLKELRCEIEQSKALHVLDRTSRQQLTGNMDIEESLNTSVCVTDIEQGSLAVLTIKPFATGSFDDSAIQRSVENSENSDDIETSNDNGLAQSEVALSKTSINIVQDLQMCRTDSQVFFKVTKRRRLDFSREADRRVINDGAHYMRYSLAVYGHLMYLAQNPCSAPCCLLSGYLTCRGRSTGRSLDVHAVDGPIQVAGNGLFGCNQLGFLVQAGLHHTDLVYASFKTGIKACPYVIAVDTEKKSVVLAIKGTFSLESIVADLNVRPELVEIYADICDVFAEPIMVNEYCHSGMLHCAVYLYKELERHKTLDRLLLDDDAKLPEYSLVITGHSLGAGCAAILAIMLRNKFPGLRCLCFAPPGCVVSLSSAQDQHITSYVIDSDLVPRLSVHSVVGLRNDVLDMIARISVPKHKLVAVGCDEKAEFAHRRGSIPLSPYYAQVLKFKDHQEQLRIEHDIPDVKLYPPGRIVHLVENRTPVRSYRHHRASYIPVWAERADFAEIQLTKSFLSDHDPGHYLRHLTSLQIEMASRE